MFFILFTLGFVAVVMTCMIMINRWMVSKRPKALDSRDQAEDPPHQPAYDSGDNSTHDSAYSKDTSADLKDG
jgi:hypothetical protein